MTRSVATPKVDIDQQTKDELQPPCDAVRPGGIPCENPAEWICWVACANCGSRAGLDCTEHLQKLVQSRIHCLLCGEAGLRCVSTEPLQ